MIEVGKSNKQERTSPRERKPIFGEKRKKGISL